jgi:lysophospholipase L1-like esterase
MPESPALATAPTQPQALPSWLRLTLLGCLAPVLWLQGRYVRRITPRLPEPPGPRTGTVGAGPALRVLIAGDSAAAGVGAADQAQALSGQLLQHLAAHYTVRWDLWATTGHDSPALQARLDQASAQTFDVVVLSMGVNDVTALRAPAVWVQHQERIASTIQTKFDPRLLVHCAVPPMHALSALPQPLRWFMGQWAHAMNAGLHRAVAASSWRRLHSLPSQNAQQGLASDGFHPGPAGYAAWGQALATHVLAELQHGKAASR